MPELCYFDWAATAIPDEGRYEEKYEGKKGKKEKVEHTALPWGNPSSLYNEGKRAKAALEGARSRCAAVLGVAPQQLYFTSGATESNAIVLYSSLFRRPSITVLYSAVEHSSIRENGARLERLGRSVSIIPVERDGRVSTVTLSRALDKNPCARLAAIMAVNNETGSIMDMPALTRCIRDRSGAPVHIHSDCVQALGKVPVDVTAWDIDSAALSAHKLGGPRGIGLLYLRKPLEALYAGGGQEGGVRPGTENVAGAIALAECLERRTDAAGVTADYEQACARFARLIDFLHSIDRCSLVPDDRQRIDSRFSPYIVQVAFDGIPGEVLVRALDDAGIAVSTGAACSVNSRERPVLAAMNLAEHTQLEGIRISQGWSTTMNDIDRLCSALQNLLQFL
jgi:cysteine desulfurase